MPIPAKIRSLQIRPFLSTDLSFPKAGLLETRHLDRAKLGYQINAFDVAAEIHARLRVRNGNTLTGTADFIRDQVRNAVLFTQRNAELQAELERVLARRDVLFLEKYQAGNMAALQAAWKDAYIKKLDHLMEQLKAIELRHGGLDDLYKNWEIQRFRPDGTRDGAPVKANSKAFKPEIHNDSVIDNKIERQGDVPWIGGSTSDETRTAFTTSRTLPVGSMQIGTSTMINAVTTGAEGEEERRHRHSTAPTLSIPTTGWTAAILQVLDELPIQMEEDGHLSQQMITTLGATIANLRRYIAQETETFTPTQRSLHFNEDARHPWAEELTRFHRECAALREEILQQATYNRRLDNLENIWQLELQQLENEAVRIMVAFADTFLTCPITGTVTSVYKDAGEYVQAGEPVIRVESNDRFLAVGIVNCRQPLVLQLQAQITLLNVLEDNQSLQLRGNIVSIRGHDSDNDEWEVIIEISAPANLLQRIPLNYTFDRGSFQHPETEIIFG